MPSTTTTPTTPKSDTNNIAKKAQAISLLAVLVIGLCGGFVGSAIYERTSDTILSTSLGEEKKIVTENSQLITSIAKKVSPSVVSVNVSVANEPGATDFLQRYYGIDEPQESQGAGTGVIISSSGLILTNRHVVPAGTSKVSITLSDGTELTDVSVVGRTSDSDTLDIAILKVGDTKGKKLSPAVLGEASKVAVGDEVVAIGNALGQFQNTVTTGIISGYGRNITAGSADSEEAESLENLFQTDAAINEGNSGGPLVNLNGQVIGINTAVASDSQSIGFAIPIDDIKGLINRVVKTGKFERPYLGVRYISLTADIAKQYELSVNTGAYIVPADVAGSPSLVPGGAADKAGLKEKDVITKVAGVSVDATHSLTSLLGRHQPGDKVKLTIVNGKDTRTVEVTLGTAPSS